MRSGKLDANAFARGLEAIENSSRSQSKLIEDLMDYSRVSSGNFKFSLSTFNPAQVIQSAVALVHPACESNQVSLKVNLPDNPGEIHADSERIQQVLNNLLGNALKFTPTGGSLEITLESNPKEIVIIVQDNGVGIPPDFLPHIFDRYRQSDMDAPRKQRGIGLGLPISRYIVEAHGGIISASSDGVGKGAQFTLKLSRQKPPCEPA